MICRRVALFALLVQSASCSQSTTNEAVGGAGGSKGGSGGSTSTGGAAGTTSAGGTAGSGGEAGASISCSTETMLCNGSCVNTLCDVATGIDARRIAIDSENIFVTYGATGTVGRMSKSGEMYPQTVPNDGAEWIAVSLDDSGVYWTTEQGVRRSEKDFSSVMTLWSGASPQRIKFFNDQ